MNTKYENLKLDKIFSYETKTSEIKDICKYIQDTFTKENGYNSIPRNYYPFLYKLLSYRKFDERGNYKEGDIKTFFIGKDAYNHNSIMFFDKNNNCNCIGYVHALEQFQKEKNIQWENERDAVIGVLRNIALVAADKLRNKISFPVKSQISGKLILDKKDLHIDHYNKEFAEVAYDWIYCIKKQREKNLKRLDDTIHFLYSLIDKDKKYFDKEKAPNLSKSFYDYHNKNTHLRIVTKQENLSRKKTKINWEYLKLNGKYIEERNA